MGGPLVRLDAFRVLEEIPFDYLTPSVSLLRREPQAADALAQQGYLAVIASERNTDDEAMLAVDLALGEFTTRWHPSVTELWLDLGGLPTWKRACASVGRLLIFPHFQ
jgi:hypothetical protein